jgi:hypothetical protein
MRIVICLVLIWTTAFAEDIKGFWKSLDDSGKPDCMIAIYEHENVRYGRIIGTYADGVMNDTIYHPVGRAEGVVGDPYFAGLDLLWNLVPNDDSYKGKVIDPQKGGVYDARLWVEDGKLILRGQMTLLFITVGRNKEWFPVVSSDFPKGFIVPDTSKFIPVIPESD